MFDFYTQLAAELFGKTYETVTVTQRNFAKRYFHIRLYGN